MNRLLTLNSLLDHYTNKDVVDEHLLLLKLQAGFELVNLKAYASGEDHLNAIYMYITGDLDFGRKFSHLYAELCLNLFKCKLVSGKFNMANRYIESIPFTTPNVLEAYLCAAEFALDNSPHFPYIKEYARIVSDSFKNLKKKTQDKLRLRILLVFVHVKAQSKMDIASKDIIEYGTEALALLNESQKDVTDEKFAFSIIDLLYLLSQAFYYEKRLDKAFDYLNQGYEIVNTLILENFHIYSKAYIDFVTYYARFLSDNRRFDTALHLLLTCEDKIHFLNDGSELEKKTVLNFRFVIAHVYQALDQNRLARVYLTEAINFILKDALNIRNSQHIFIEIINQQAKLDVLIDGRDRAFRRYEFGIKVINEIAKTEDQLNFYQAKIIFGKYIYTADIAIAAKISYALEITALYCQRFAFNSQFLRSTGSSNLGSDSERKYWVFLKDVLKYLIDINFEAKNYEYVFHLYLVLLDQQKFLDADILSNLNMKFETYLRAAEAAIRVSNLKFAILQFAECEKMLGGYSSGYQDIESYRQWVFRLCLNYGLDRSYIIEEINRILYSHQPDFILTLN